MISFFMPIMACIAFGCLDQFRQASGHDLPGKAELILEPAALNLDTSCGELRPIVVHFLLRVAAHHKRDRFRELEDGPPLRAVNFWPSSSKAMVRMLPFGPGLSSPLRNSWRRRELLKTVR